MTKKLLVVDSNLAIQKLVEHNLPQPRFAVTCLNDGLSALDLFDQIAPDLVLVDYHLEGISITRFCEKLKQKPTGVERPILLLVGPTDSYDVNRLLALGVVDFVRKPLDPKELIEKLNNLSEETATVVERTPVPASTAMEKNAPETAPTPPPMAPSDIAKIEELLGWSLPGEKKGTPVPPTVMDNPSTPAIESVPPELQGDSVSREESMTEVAAPPPALEDMEKTMLSTPGPSPGLKAQPPPSEPAPITGGTAAPPDEAPPPITKETLETVFPQLYSVPDSINAPTAPGPSDSGTSATAALSPEAAQAILKESAREIIEKVAWDVVPRLAEAMIREELERLKSERPG